MLLQLNEKVLLEEQLKRSGTPFDGWHISEYATRDDGIAYLPEGGYVIVVDNADDGSYAEWVFDHTATLVQFAVWGDSL